MPKKRFEEELEEEFEDLTPSPSPLGEGSEQPPPDLTSDPSPVGDRSEEEYEVRDWMGKTLYVCKTCATDVFDFDEMINHLIEKHNSESALQKLYEGKKE